MLIDKRMHQAVETIGELDLASRCSGPALSWTGPVLYRFEIECETLDVHDRPASHNGFIIL